MAKKTVWVLTREHNEYDQHGQYFVAAFERKPDIKALAEFFKGEGSFGFLDIMAGIAFLEHILNGGGREDREDVWYNLFEEELR